MQINGMSAEQLQAGMEHESTCKKCCIAIGSVIHMLAAAAIGIVYAVYWSNANSA